MRALKLVTEAFQFRRFLPQVRLDGSQFVPFRGEDDGFRFSQCDELFNGLKHAVKISKDECTAAVLSL
jgi:hypothetical protein